MLSAILAAKLIKYWYEVVVEEEETTKLSQEQPNSVQHLVDTLSKSLELLMALQKVSQQVSSDQESQLGIISKPLSKPQAGFPPQKSLLALQTT